MKSTTTIKGKRGEFRAKKFLEEVCSFKIIKQNYRYKRGEVDLIVQDGATLVFVEVKTRSTDVFGDPSKSVVKGKQKRTIEAANAYLEKFEIDLEARFDIISIVTFESKTNIDHMEDAFFPLA